MHDVVQIINEAGTIVNSYSYDEWGNIRSKTETISNPIRYAGEYFDEESGLYYLRARYYDPVIARFITKDSYEGDISNPLSINQYSYCWNNPLIYCDLTGHYVDESKLGSLVKEGYTNVILTYTPGKGDTLTVTNPLTGTTITISDSRSGEYFDPAERVHDLAGYANVKPSSSDGIVNSDPDPIKNEIQPTGGNSGPSKKELKAAEQKATRNYQFYDEAMPSGLNESDITEKTTIDIIKQTMIDTWNDTGVQQRIITTLGQEFVDLGVSKLSVLFGKKCAQLGLKGVIPILGEV